MFTLKCRDCGKTIISDNRYRKVCSDCLKKHRREVDRRYKQSATGQQHSKLYRLANPDKCNPHIACPQCGKPMSKTSKLCQACRYKIRRGEGHPSWKGGRYKAHGYILLYKPDYSRAMKNGYVLEHILVWEKAHGKPLPKGWIIHHLNGIKDDNRPVNLQALPNKKHYLLLQAKAKRIQELEGLLNNQSQLL